MGGASVEFVTIRWPAEWNRLLFQRNAFTMGPVSKRF